LYVACVLAAFIGMEVWGEWTGREAAVRRAHTEMANLASSLRQHADDTFQIAEVMLAGVVQHFQVEGFNPTSVARAAATMRAAITEGTRIQGLYIFDADGNWVVNSVHIYPEGVNNADRAYFQYHKANQDPTVRFTSSLRSRTGSNEQVMVLSRRIDGPDGSFAGVAAIGISAKTFADYYQTFDVGTEGAITLLTRDGEIISRMPYDETVMGTNISSSPSYRNTGGQQRDRFRFVSPIDNVLRLGGVSISKRYPVMLMASKSEREATAQWLEGAIQRSIVAIGFLLLAAVLGLRLADQSRKRRSGEDALLAKDAEFRILAEHSNDLVERFDADGVRRYASPAALPLLGYRPEELIGKSAFDLIVEEDMPEAMAATERMRNHMSLQETLTLRLRRKDGRVIWVEAAIRFITDENNQDVGVIINTRDATERKEAEMQLAAMAASDGLTGLQNRRVFDEALIREVARSRRTRTPLSLLLVDVDRFKLFNDEYGHMAGDTCLKSIASVLRLAAQRGGDVAARYGGEEFAVLLPDTNGSAAAFVAGELCRQIEALSIPHGDNTPWGVATVSVGVSTIENRRDEPDRDGNWLVSTADMALYQAKAEGRNRSKGPGRDAPAYERDAG
jgi:diguanylate cyclase (GGDEF)-like protein/PAS domain S-box-containing protein